MSELFNRTNDANNSRAIYVMCKKNIHTH